MLPWQQLLMCKLIIALKSLFYRPDQCFWVCVLYINWNIFRKRIRLRINRMEREGKKTFPLRTLFTKSTNHFFFTSATSSSCIVNVRKGISFSFGMSVMRLQNLPNRHLFGKHLDIYKNMNTNKSNTNTKCMSSPLLLCIYIYGM